MKQPFKHEDFRFGYEIVLGSAYRGHADVGEVLSTAGRIKGGDADGWVREWSATSWPPCPASGSRSPTRAPPCPATSSAPPTPRPASGDTIYLTAADKDGNVVSLIQSIYESFGAGIVGLAGCIAVSGDVIGCRREYSRALTRFSSCWGVSGRM